MNLETHIRAISKPGRGRGSRSQPREDRRWVSLLLPLSTFERLQKLTDQGEEPRSVLIRRAVERLLEDNGL